MKKFVCFLGVITICFLILQNNYVPVNNFANGYSGTYYFYTSEDFCSDFTTTVSNGNEYIVSCDIDMANFVYNILNNNCIRGESFQFTKVGDRDLEKLIIKLGIQYFSKNDDEILGYSSIVPYSVKLDNNIFNVQIAETNSQITIGFPMILGSF